MEGFREGADLAVVKSERLTANEPGVNRRIGRAKTAVRISGSYQQKPLQRSDLVFSGFLFLDFRRR